MPRYQDFKKKKTKLMFSWEKRKYILNQRFQTENRCCDLLLLYICVPLFYLLFSFLLWSDDEHIARINTKYKLPSHKSSVFFVGYNMVCKILKSSIILYFPHAINSPFRNWCPYGQKTYKKQLGLISMLQDLADITKETINIKIMKIQQREKKEYK